MLNIVDTDADQSAFGDFQSSERFLAGRAGLPSRSPRRAEVEQQRQGIVLHELRDRGFDVPRSQNRKPAGIRRTPPRYAGPLDWGFNSARSFDIDAKKDRFLVETLNVQSEITVLLNWPSLLIK